MSIKVSFRNANAGILFGELNPLDPANPLDAREADDISLDTPVQFFEFAASGGASSTNLFKDFQGNTGNASYNNKMILVDDSNPDYQPTLKDYLRYTVERALEEGLTTKDVGITVSKPNGGARKNFTFGDLTS